MRVILNVLEGPQQGRAFTFERAEAFIVGRSRLVDCPLPEDGALSRDHFVIEPRPPDGCELRDLKSTNGTFVNRKRVERAWLADGDVITAGQSVFQVTLRPAEGSSPRTAPRRRPEAETTEGPTFDTPRREILCGGCGVPAPPGMRVAQEEGELRHDTIHWLCDQCRAEIALTPQPVPQYTTLRELGRGAMGVVYLARHNATNRKVALKLIIPESAAARSAIDRFLREMSVISQLKHPNIVEWLEQGTTGGRFWFAMEYIDGTNLEALALSAAGRYPVHQACRMACQILKGLDHAHRLGFVHRDIKPENILIGRDEQRRLVAKISDFGLAKSYRGIGLSGLTFSGEMRGTIPFMPPEQVLDFKKVRPSADLYAAAATLYYLITGDYIYDDIGDGADVVQVVMEEEPVPIRQRRPDVPPELAAVIDRGLAREPGDRFPDASALRQALRPFC